MKRIVCWVLAMLFLAAPAAGARAAGKEKSAAAACSACGMEMPDAEYCPWCGTASGNGMTLHRSGRERPEDVTKWMTAAALAERYGAKIRDGVPEYTPADPLPLTAFIVLDDRSEGTDGSGIGALTEKGISSGLSGVLQKCADRIRAESENTICFTSDPDKADLLFVVMQTYPYRGEYKSRSGQRASGYGCRIEITVTQLSHPAYTLSTYESNMPPDSVTTSGGGTFWMDQPDIASKNGLKRLAENILYWYGYQVARKTDQKDRNDVLLVQRTLADRGYYAGKITGKADEATAAAIRALQEDSGLQATGQIDRGTLLALYFDEPAYRSYTRKNLSGQVELYGRRKISCPGCGRLHDASEMYAYCTRCGTALPEYPSEGLRTAEGARIPEEATADVGDIVLFGRYEQDNDRANGPEPVEWIVIDKEGENLRLLSRYALTARPSDSTWNAVEDRSRNLRSMLQDVFADALFTQREQRILRYRQEDGKRNTTMMFSLTAEEAEKYFGTEEARLCSPTKFAVERGAGKNAAGYCSWWLDGPLQDWRQFALVTNSGEIRTADVDGKTGSVGVRPSLWIDPAAPQPGIPERAETVAIGEAQAGDVVLFGRYEQDALASDGPEPIEWIVLAREKNRLLLLSRLALDSRAFGWKEGLTWENSAMRAWLNETFAGRAFSAEERSAILSVKLKTPKNSEYKTKGGKDTKDTVFLLSEDEWNKYVRRTEGAACTATEYALERGASAGEDGSVRWWLRTPGHMESSRAYADREGKLVLMGESAMNHGSGIRPAVWIRAD